LSDEGGGSCRAVVHPWGFRRHEVGQVRTRKAHHDWQGRQGVARRYRAGQCEKKLWRRSPSEYGQGRCTRDTRMGQTEGHPDHRWRGRIVLGRNRYLDVDQRKCCESVPRCRTPSTDRCHSVLVERFDSREHRTRAAVWVTCLVHWILRLYLEHLKTRSMAKTVPGNG